MSARLAIVIVSYNTARYLRRCLESLTLSLTRYPIEQTEIVVADNGSTDDSLAMLETGFPSIRTIPLGENRGFAAANNVAVRLTPAENYLFLNPDTEVLGNAPAAMLDYLFDSPRVGVCCGRLLNPDLSFQHSCFHFPTLPMSLLDFYPINHRLSESWLNGRYPRGAYRRSFQIDHPLGACMLVRNKVVEQVGGFDEGYFMYCEEVDWCRRIRQAGWDIAYTPTAEVIHHVGASTRQYAGPMLVQLHRSRDRYFQKHSGPVFAWLARQIVRLGMLTAARRARREFLDARIDAMELQRRLDLFELVATW